MRMMKVVYFLEKFLKTAAPENTLLKSEYDAVNPPDFHSKLLEIEYEINTWSKFHTKYDCLF